MTAIPLAEWRPDVAALNSSFTGDVLNVLCSGAGYIPFPQLAVFSGALKLKDTTGSFLTQTYKMAGVTATEADALSLSRSSTATYFDAEGVLQSAASDVLRIDHDPVTGDALGALIEDDAENLLIYSEEFDQSSAWTAINSSFVADQVAAPDGTTAADKFVENSGDSTHEFFYAGTATVTANSNYAGGLFIKAAGRTKGVLQYVAPGGLTGVNCIFDLTAKTFSSLAFGTATLADAGLDDVGGGWFRVWVSGIIDATSTSGGIVIILADDDGNTTYTGDGTSGLYVWGAQLEAGTKPTSYIKTSSASVTRAADALTLNATGSYDWFLTLGDDTVKTFSANTDDLAVSASDLTSKYIQSYQAVNVDVNVPLGCFCARQLDGTITVFAGSATKLWKLDNTDFTWTDVSHASTTYSANSTSAWDFNLFGSFVIAVNQNDNPQVFELGTDTAFSDLGGSPPKAGKVKIWGDFVVLMQLTDHPNRVQWSGLNDATSWTAGTDNSDFQDFPDGGVVQGSTEQTNPLIFQERAIRLATFLPGSTEIFSFQKIHDLRGAKSASSIAHRGDYAFYADEGGFFQIGMDGSLASIGFEKVDRTVFGSMTAADIAKIWGAVDPFFSRVYWAVNLKGGDNYDTILVYDWNLQRWTKIAVTVQNLIPLATAGYTLETLDSVSSSLDALPFSLDSKVWQGGAPILGAFNADAKLCSFSGAAMEAIITTQETGDTTGNISFISSLAPVVDTDTYTVEIGSRMKRGDSVTWTGELSPNSVTGRVDTRNASRFQRMRMTIPAGTLWTIAQMIDITAKPAGRR